MLDIVGSPPGSNGQNRLRKEVGATGGFAGVGHRAPENAILFQ
jgi:hypothetical protein